MQRLRAALQGAGDDKEDGDQPRGDGDQGVAGDHVASSGEAGHERETKGQQEQYDLAGSDIEEFSDPPNRFMKEPGDAACDGDAAGDEEGRSAQDHEQHKAIPFRRRHVAVGALAQEQQQQSSGEEGG